MPTDTDLDRMRRVLASNGCLFRTDALALIEEIARLKAERPVTVTVIEAHEDAECSHRWDDDAGIAWAR